MKIRFVLIVFLFALIFLSCKKREVPPPPVPKEVVKITENQFLQGLGARTDVKNLKIGDSLRLAINPGEVLSPSAEFAVVKLFKTDWSYRELLMILEKLPLTVVWDLGEGTQLLVENYLDLKNNYNSSEKFLVLNPKPVYSVRVGNKEYWVGSSGKFWKTW